MSKLREDFNKVGGKFDIIFNSLVALTTLFFMIEAIYTNQVTVSSYVATSIMLVCYIALTTSLQLLVKKLVKESKENK